MTCFTRITALAITSLALAAPIAQASSTTPLTAAETARLGAQTEAQGFKGIARYPKLRYAREHAAQTAQVAQTAHSGVSSSQCPCNIGLPGEPVAVGNAGMESDNRAWGWEAHLGIDEGAGLLAEVTKPSFQNRFTRGD